MTRDDYRRTMRGLMREATAADDANLRRTIALYRDEPKRCATFAARALDSMAQSAESTAKACPALCTDMGKSADVARRAAACFRAYAKTIASL